MQERPTSDPARCVVHGLARGEDGACVRCRRDAEQARGRGRTTVVIGAVVLLVAALGAAIALRPPPVDPAAVQPIAAAPVPPIAPAATPVPPPPPAPDRAFAAPSRPIAVPAAQPPVEDPTARANRENEAYVAAARARRAAESAQQAITAVRVTMYSTSWCGYCKQARAWLTQEGVAFTDHDVEREPAAQERMHALNPRGGVPTFEVDGQVITGFSPGSLTAALTRAAMSRARR